MRLERPAGLAGAAVLAIAVAAISSTAFAYFTAAGVGEASAGVTRLSAPSIGSAVPAPSAVTLSWSAVTAPGPGTVTYTVTRDGGEPAGNCPGRSAPSSTTSCTDKGLEIGIHTYTVTARWRSWTAVSAPAAAEVSVAAATHFVLSAVSSTPAAGTADNLTITAKDSKGNTATSYAGSHNLVFSGASSSSGGNAPTVANSSGAAKAFGSETAITFTAGVASVSGTTNGVMTLYAAEAAAVSVSDGSIKSEPNLEVTVISGAATKLSLAATSTTPVAGAADNLTITALDVYGNVATTYNSSHNLVFSGASASPSGETPTVTNNGGVAKAFGIATTITFASGVTTVSGAGNGVMKLYKSGSASLTVSDGSISSAATAVTASPAPASQLSLAAASTTPVAGAPDNLTVTALDPYGNTATAYTGSHNLVFSGAGTSPSGSAPTVISSGGSTVNFGGSTAIGFSAGVAQVAASKNGVMKLNKAETASVVASDGTISTPTGLAITVSPGAASKLALTHVTTTGAVSTTCLFTCTVTTLGNNKTIQANVAVADSLGNTVSALGSGHSVNVTSTGGTITGAPLTLTIPTTGPAESASQFTYTSKSSGNFTDTITVATSAGTVYTSATLTASK